MSQRKNSGEQLGAIQAVREAIDVGDVERARVLLAEVSSRGPFRDQWFLVKAVLIEHTEGVRSAANFLERSLRPARNFVEARAHLAELFFRLADYRRSAFHLEGLLAGSLNDIQRAGVLYNLGRCYESAEMGQLAVKYYQMVPEESHHFFDAVHSAAMLMVRLGRGHAGLRFFLDTLVASPRESSRDASWWRLLQNLVLKVNLPNLVREELSLRCAHLGVPMAVGLHVEGLLFEQVGEFSRAAECYEQALESDPTSKVSRYNLGLVQLRLKHLKDGFANYYARRFVDEFTANCLSRVVRERLAQTARATPSESHHLFAWYEQGLGETLLFLAFVRERIDTKRVTCVIQDRLYSALLTYEHETGRNVLIGTMPESQAIAAGASVDALIGDLAGQVCQGHFGPNFPDSRPLGQSTADSVGPKGSKVIRVGLCGNSYNPELGTAKSVSLQSLVTYARENFAEHTIEFFNLDHRLDDHEFDLVCGKASSSEAVTSPCRIKASSARTEEKLSLEEICRRLATLDVVIASSCTVVHLAGFLSVPTKILLTATSRGRFWYWGGMDSESPQCFWYKSVSLA